MDKQYTRSPYNRMENESDWDYSERICKALAVGALHTAQELGMCKGHLLDRYVSYLISENILK